eukprot:scaffold131301_cov32-Tisochrysis_lutea.AAC.4
MAESGIKRNCLAHIAALGCEHKWVLAKCRLVLSRSNTVGQKGKAESPKSRVLAPPALGRFRRGPTRRGAIRVREADGLSALGSGHAPPRHHPRCPRLERGPPTSQRRAMLLAGMRDYTSERRRSLRSRTRTRPRFHGARGTASRATTGMAGRVLGYGTRHKALWRRRNSGAVAQ